MARVNPRARLNPEPSASRRRAIPLSTMSMLFSRSAGTSLRAAAPSTRAFSSTPAQQATLRELEMRIKSVGNIGAARLARLARQGYPLDPC